MKLFTGILTIILFATISGCSDKEEVNLYASITDNEELKKIATNLKSEIDGIKENVSDGNGKIENLFNIMNEKASVLDRVASNSKFIEDIKNVDWQSITTLKTKVKDLEIENEKIRTEKEKILLLKKTKAAKEKSKLSVSVSEINNWGGSLVAIVNIPGQGFKTLSVNSAVGNGWVISKIADDSVSFVHMTGRESHILL